MKRRILLVDDEVAVLLTLKAVLEISGFIVDTAASAREGISKLHTRDYQMLINDMRMENDASGVEVIKAARAVAYRPAIALLTAFPVAEEDWLEMGAHKLLVKPMHTRILLQQIESLIASHEARLAASLNGNGAINAPAKKARTAIPARKKSPATKSDPKPLTKKTATKKAAAKKAAPVSSASKKPRAAVKAPARKLIKKPSAKA